MWPINRGLDRVTTGASYNIYGTLHKKEKSIPNTGIAAIFKILHIFTIEQIHIFYNYYFFVEFIYN